jgi:hypothetical protein
MGSQSFSIQEPVFPKLNERLQEIQRVTPSAATA